MAEKTELVNDYVIRTQMYVDLFKVSFFIMLNHHKTTIWKNMFAFSKHFKQLQVYWLGLQAYIRYGQIIATPYVFFHPKKVAKEGKFPYLSEIYVGEIL